MDNTKIIREDGLEALGRYYGNYKGFVADNQDPLELNRLKLKVPTIYGSEVHDYWALPKGSAIFFTPDKDTPVWVEFEGGDPRFPIWSHGNWQKDKQPEGAKTTVKVWATTKGHSIKLDDEGSITITAKDGSKVTLDDKVTLVSKDGHEVALDGSVSLGKQNNPKQPAVLGDSNADALRVLATAISNLVNAIAVAVPVPSDGGAAVVTALKTATAADIQQLAVLLATDIELTKAQSVQVD